MKIAQVDWGELEQTAAPRFAGRQIGFVITRALSYLFPLMGFALLIYFVYGGYQILVSEQNPKKMAQGYNTILYAIIGFAIMFLAYWLVQIVGRALGIEAINNLFQPSMDYGPDS